MEKMWVACKSFEALTIYELYDIMALRQEVFVVEQNCAYLDADGKDLQAWHVMGRDEQGRLVAYTRLLPVGVVYEGYASIGRVVSAPFARRTGAGRSIMEHSIALCRQLFGSVPLKISAQTYLLKFYESFGFRSTGEAYLEDGIPHTTMIREHY
ncbi:MAG: GNAT family N-acetyltransferase [Saprospiraceae bacterium]|nr:GNAT family N-acetyltransferase [Saprospiraceae bacterium]MDW8482881.1 GNAT family N-acetyltransferase [Saprospiraceae bacterium]